MGSSTAESIQKFVEREDEERTEMAEAAQMAECLLNEIKGIESVPFVIQNDEDYELATTMLTDAKKQIKEIERRRKTVTQPLDQALRAFRALYRPTLKVYESIEQLLKKKISDYTLEKRRQEEEAMRQMAEASREGDFAKALAVSDALKKAPVAKGVTVTEEWTYEVTDLSKVPREWLTLNHAAMVSYVQKAKPEKPEPVAGIRFFKKGKVIARTK